MIQTIGSGGSESGRMFPVYDGHGNMICTVARNGTSGYYAPKDVKEFGPWGDVRNSANASALPPNKGYCANLGHKLDDESGLVYMRARYYEPTSGRFISEDPARNGWSWFAYCCNAPSCKVDESGKEDIAPWPFIRPLGRLLWLLNAVLSAVAVGCVAVALGHFVSDLGRATDATMVEAGWGAFMKDFQKRNMLNELDSSGTSSRGLALASWALRAIANLGSSSSLAGIGMTLVSGLLTGAQLWMLGIGYQLRTLWYVHDID